MNRRSTRHSVSSQSSTSVTTKSTTTVTRGSSRNRQPPVNPPVKDEKPKETISPKSEAKLKEQMIRSPPKVKIMLEQMNMAPVEPKPTAIPTATIISPPTELSAIFENSERDEDSVARSSSYRRSRSLVSQFSKESSISKMSQFSKPQMDYEYDDNKYARRQQSKSAVFLEWLWFGFAIIFNCIIQMYSYLDKQSIAKVENTTATTTSKHVNLFKEADWSMFLNLFKSIELAGVYLGVLILTAILSLVPIGRIVTIKTDCFDIHQYVFNGIGAAIVIVGALFGLENYFKCGLFKLLNNSFTGLFFINLFVHLGIALIMKHKNIQENSVTPTNPNGSFLAGRDSNPILCKRLNTKLILKRVSIIFSLIFNAIYLCKSLKINISALKSNDFFGLINFESPSVVVGLLFLIYHVDLLLFESHTTFSFELHQEFLGANTLIRHAIYPFTNVMILRHFVGSNNIVTRSSTVLFTISVVCFLAGVWIKRSAQFQKHAFRMNPDADQFRSAYTIATHQIGRREFLLASKWWSTVRHPNYFGDILCSMSLAATLLHPSVAAISWCTLLCTLWTVVVLIARQRHVQSVNVIRYNSAWQRYCQLVPHAILPNVY